MQEINDILGITESYKAPQRLLDILLGDKIEREEIFHQFLELFKWKMDYDWFHQYFELEHADRKDKKQDFTPMSVSNLINSIVDDNGMYFESCAGTGGMCISHWHNTRLKSHPLRYKPSEYLHILEEMSDRAIPFLLFNVAIRGMNAAILHCNSLIRECYGAFLVQNEKDLAQEFSSISVMPYSERCAKYFNVQFIERRYQNHVESAVMT